MNELIIGLLGGGAAVQLLSALLTLRQNRRQMNASALGEEVTALEKTIRVLQQNFMDANEQRRRETEELRGELAEAERRCTLLRDECEDTVSLSVSGNGH